MSTWCRTYHIYFGCINVWLDKCRERVLERDKMWCVSEMRNFLPAVCPFIRSFIRPSNVFYIVIHFPQKYFCITYTFLRITFYTLLCTTSTMMMKQIYIYVRYIYDTTHSRFYFTLFIRNTHKNARIQWTSAHWYTF